MLSVEVLLKLLLGLAAGLLLVLLALEELSQLLVSESLLLLVVGLVYLCLVGVLQSHYVPHRVVLLLPSAHTISEAAAETAAALGLLVGAALGTSEVVVLVGLSGSPCMALESVGGRILKSLHCLAVLESRRLGLEHLVQVPSVKILVYGVAQKTFVQGRGRLLRRDVPCIVCKCSIDFECFTCIGSKPLHVCCLLNSLMLLG